MVMIINHPLPRHICQQFRHLTHQHQKHHIPHPSLSNRQVRNRCIHIIHFPSFSIHIFTPTDSVTDTPAYAGAHTGALDTHTHAITPSDSAADNIATDAPAHTAPNDSFMGSESHSFFGAFSCTFGAAQLQTHSRTNDFSSFAGTYDVSSNSGPYDLVLSAHVQRQFSKLESERVREI